MTSWYRRAVPRQSSVALMALGGLLGCGDGLGTAGPFDGGPPVTDASCSASCGDGQVCEYPGAIGDEEGEAGQASSPSCTAMPAACAGANDNCGCLWQTLCDGGGVGVACSYNQATGYFIVQCIAN